MKNSTSASFPLGRVVATRAALSVFTKAEIFQCLSCHATGDWGVLCEEDSELNREALKQGYRIFSKYNLSNDRSMYIITEHNRSYTTIMLPDDY